MFWRIRRQSLQLPASATGDSVVLCPPMAPALHASPSISHPSPITQHSLHFPHRAPLTRFASYRKEV